MGKKSIRILLGLGLMISTTALKAEERACSELGMGVIYKDTLYGLGTGVILTGLTMVALDSYGHTSQRLAAGGLIGAGIGAGIGALEVMTRDCRSGNLGRSGWKVPNLKYQVVESSVARPGTNFGINFTYVINDVSHR